MRTHFDAVLHEGDKEKSVAFSIECRLYMSYWYAGLFVVIEGWKCLKLQDEKINELLTSKNVDLLRQYRNGTFHFQKKYYDDKFLKFILDGENCVEWVRTLNEEFGRYFHEILKYES
jgi:hypothetical protein